MKKIAVFLAIGLLNFVFVGAAFAQTQQVSEKLCPPGTFSGLCNINLVGSNGSVVGAIVTVLFVVAILACLFFLIFGGIRWITSGGDKGKVDSARNTIVAAIVGLVISLLAFAILDFILVFFTGKGLAGITVPTLLQ